MRHLASIVALSLAVAPALAGEKKVKLGTPQEAKALLDRAVKEVEEKGEVESMSAFENEGMLGRFAPKDLRVGCYGPDHRVLVPKALASTNIAAYQDSAGGELGKALSAAVSAGEIQVKHQGRHPETGELAPQVTFVKRAAILVCWVTAFE